MPHRQTRTILPEFRRPKSDPCADFWHTLKIGVPIGIAMLFVLPVIFALLCQIGEP